MRCSTQRLHELCRGWIALRLGGTSSGAETAFAFRRSAAVCSESQPSGSRHASQALTRLLA
eukprot:2573014-Rhodomonas_salina.5